MYTGFRIRKAMVLHDGMPYTVLCTNDEDIVWVTREEFQKLRSDLVITKAGTYIKDLIRKYDGPDLTEFSADVG